MSLIVFGYNDDTKEITGPLFQSEVEKPLHINMLFLEDGGSGHYMYIKIFQGKFLYSFLSL